MSKLKVKNGTPVGNEHLCRSCSNGQFTVGYRESDVLVDLHQLEPGTAGSVSRSTSARSFWDRNRPGYDEMTQAGDELQ